MIRLGAALLLRAVLGLASLFPAAPRAWAAEAIDVIVGRSAVLSPGGAISTIAVGDPEIADATTAAGNKILVTAKKVGTTNLIVLDERGAEVLVSTVRVVPADPRPRYTVSVVRGGTRTAYICGPDPGCAPTNGGSESPGPCNSPDDIAADGSRCGARASTERPEGRP